jgi:hypothetical protein
MIGNDERQQIILALKIIKSECKNHARCEDCPLYSLEGISVCGVRKDMPRNWEINDNEKWKAFR